MANLITGVSSLRAQPPRGAERGAAYVKRDRMEWVLPLPQRKGPNAPDALRGYWAWRVVIDERSDESLALVSELVSRDDELATIVRGSRLYRCDNAGVASVLDCQKPVAGKVTLEPSGIRVTITDAVFVERMRRVRPARFWLYTYMPGGRFSTFPVAFTYQEVPPSTKSQY